MSVLAKIEELERRCPGVHVHRDVLDGGVLVIDTPCYSGRTEEVTVDLLGETFEEWIDKEIPLHPEPPQWMTPRDDDGRYNVICPVHGKQQIGHRGYVLQMEDANASWICPLCGLESEFDDDSYEE